MKKLEASIEILETKDLSTVSAVVDNCGASSDNGGTTVYACCCCCC